MKRCSTLHTTRELQMKTTRYYYTPIKMVKIQNTDNTKCRWGCGAAGILTLLVGMQNGAATLEDRIAFPYKTKHTLNHMIQQLCSLAFTQISWSMCPHKTCTWAFTDLFITDKTWKQPKCPSMGEWIVWYIHTMDYLFFSIKWVIKPLKDMKEIYMHISE